MLSSFQHHDLFKRTNHLTQSYRRINSMISNRMRTQGKIKSVFIKSNNYQGENSFTCWAFSCASMLRTSCWFLIQECFEHGLISNQKRKQIVTYITQEEVHCEIRNLMMMTLVPKPLHEDGNRQAAHLRATVSRVS